MSGTYSDLEVWQAAMELVVGIYRLTRLFAKEEMYGLASQMRRAAVSVPSNITEGKGRSSDKELIQFLRHARGLLFEVQTQVTLAERLGYGAKADCDSMNRKVVRIGQMLNGLIRSVRPRSAV
ncbi:MAG TPA: four helix bundle protein [Candidatus Sulfotelmatobacter sp.]|jgi:four helix bundle protein|nr:four helix bundle protein [Candidatus Sulfotelmatobacter sp.]